MGILLYIFPHPDDESFGPGPAIFRQRREGHEVHLLTLTWGEATWHRGRLGYSKSEMAQMRYRQMQQVATTLDLSSLNVLRYPDGHLSDLNPLELEKKIADRIRAVRPDVVVTFPDHGITGHPDHIITHCIVKRVVCAMKKQGGFYPRRLAFFTLSPPSTDQNYPDYLRYSSPQRIDCLYPVSNGDLAQGRKALTYYVTYPPEDHRPLEYFMDGIPFELFDETHDPPLSHPLDFSSGESNKALARDSSIKSR